MSKKRKHIALVSWTCVDVSQLFGKQTRDLDRHTGLQTAAQRHCTLEFRDVLQPHADPCPNNHIARLRTQNPLLNSFLVIIYMYLPVLDFFASFISLSLRRDKHDTYGANYRRLACTCSCRASCTPSICKMSSMLHAAYLCD